MPQPIEDPETLASYPGVKIKNVDTRDLVIRLTNGLITDVTGPLDSVPTKVEAIALQVAKRALMNPDGAQSVTTGIDDWKKTVRFAEGEGEEAGVYLTAAEEKALRRVLRGDRPRQRVKSIRVGVPDHGAYAR